MEKFRNILLKDIESLSGKSKTELGPFIRTFFNTRSEGNRTIVLGAGDESLMKEVLSIPAGELINDDKTYLIRIKKARPSKDRIVFSFNALREGIGSTKREKIHELFRFYQYEEKVNLDSALENGVIPPICMPMTLMDFTVRKHDYLSVLSGEGMIKEVTIETSQTGSSMVARSEEIVIIPASYEPLVCNSAEFSNSKSPEKISHAFWEEFSKKNSIGHMDFNFVILNSVNDHLFRVFQELMNLYKSAHSLSKDHEHILSRVFFIRDTSLMNESRIREGVSEENSQIFPHIMSGPDMLSDERKELQLYTCLLDKLSRENNVKEAEQISECVERTEIRCRKASAMLDSALGMLSASMNMFPEAHGDICAKLEQLRRMLPICTECREATFRQVLDAMEDLLRFCEHYNRKSLPDVCSLMEDVKTQKESCLEKAKGFLRFGYVIKDKGLTQCVKSIVSKIDYLWEERILKTLDPDAWNELDHAMESYYKVSQDFQGNISSLPVPTRKLVEFGKSIDSFERSYHDLRHRMNTLHSECDMSNLKSGDITAELDSFINEWKDRQPLMESSDGIIPATTKEDNLNLDTIKKRLSAKINEMMKDK